MGRRKPASRDRSETIGGLGDIASESSPIEPEEWQRQDFLLYYFG